MLRLMRGEFSLSMQEASVMVPGYCDVCAGEEITSGARGLEFELSRNAEVANRRSMSSPLTIDE